MAGPADSATVDLDRHFNAAREVRRVFENEWVLLLAFMLGNQWVRVDASGRIFNVALDDDRAMITDNRMRPASRTNIARMTKGAPTWQGVPKDRSDEEIQRARLREAVFEHYWRELQMMRRYRLALWYREACGMAFLKTTWDQTAGQKMTVMAARGGGPVVADGYGRPITPDRLAAVAPQLNDQQRGQINDLLEERTVTLGDADVRLKTPFEVVVDPLATDEGLASAEYVCEEALYSPAYVREHFNYDGPLNEENTTSAGGLEGRFPGQNTYLERSRERRGAPGRRGVRLREHWSLPGLDGPRGKHVVWLPDGKTLFEEDLPYPFLPYTDFPGLPAGRFWADPPMKDLLSPQVERNKTKSQIADNADRIGNPARLISAESLGLEGNRWQGLPGEEIIYHDMGTPGSVPSWLPAPEMPRYVIEQLAENGDTFGIISGQNDVAQGNVPEGVTAASAISQLMEANNTMIGPDIEDMSLSLLDVGKKLLWCVRRYAHTDRLAKIAGDDAEFDIFEFRGEQLGEADGDAIQVGSTISQSVAAKQAGIQWVINTLIQNGQAPPPRELRKIMRDYEVGGLEHVFGSIGKTQAQCSEEHRRMLRGEELQVNSYDDDQTHLEEHDDFRRGARYQMLIRQPGGEQIDAIFEAHEQLHRDRLQQQANQQAAAQVVQQAAAAGNGPGLDPHAMAGGGNGPAIQSAAALNESTRVLPPTAPLP